MLPIVASLPVSFLPLVAILPFVAVALLAPLLRRRPAGIALLSEGAALLSLAVFGGALWGLVQTGPQTSALLGWGGVGLSARLDAVSLTMGLLIAFVGWVVLRYSRTYLRGETGQAAFTGWLAVVLAAVLLCTQAGNTVQMLAGWSVASIGLHRLLLFYPGRAAAQRAARKKFVIARASDLALAAAVGLLAIVGGTDLATLLEAARNGTLTAQAPVLTALAVGLLAVAAGLKSAQAPAHSWLTEMAEAPTPVSALLHAGVINAGGFLLVRFADLVLTSPGIMAVLVMVGGFTALYGSLVMLTQPLVKTSLAWSTVAQMGFMTMQCGLGLFPLALLHIVAHSLYKAHAFLASGSTVKVVAAARRPGPVAVPGGGAILRAFAVAFGLYLLMGLLFGFHGKSPQALALGAVLIFGVAYLIAQGLADAAPRALTVRTSLFSAVASASYFGLQTAAEALTTGTLPPAPAPGPLEIALLMLMLLSFGAVALAQVMFPLWSRHPAATGLRVHLANGLYLNALTDRLLGGWIKTL